MPYTVPNQRLIQIHRAPLGGNFLGINNDNWKYAARALGAQAFLLYIYFASNKPDFQLALSPQAIQKEIGMPPSTYRDQLKKMESLGFVEIGEGNKLHFYEDPRHGSRPELENPRVPLKEKSTAPVQESTAHAFSGTPEDIEIYINNKDKKINRPGVKSEYAKEKEREEQMRRYFNSIY